MKLKPPGDPAKETKRGGRQQRTEASTPKAFRRTRGHTNIHKKKGTRATQYRQQRAL